MIFTLAVLFFTEKCTKTNRKVYGCEHRPTYGADGMGRGDSTAWQPATS